MKKVLALLLAGIMAMSMTACSGGGTTDDGNAGNNDTPSSSAPQEEKRDYNVVIVDDMACRIPLTWTKADAGDKDHAYTLPSGADMSIKYTAKEGLTTVAELKEFYFDEYQAAAGTAEIIEEKVDQINNQMTWKLRMNLTPADGSAAREVYQYVVVHNDGYVVVEFSAEGELDADTNSAIDKIALRMRIATPNDTKEAEEILS